VDERIRSRVNARLRRELDPPGRHRPVDPLGDVDLLGDRRQEVGDLLSAMAFSVGLAMDPLLSLAVG
jgi:hypothetical protein